MSRISIDVTAEQHQRLKALAALQGMSIKDFVLSSTLGAHKRDPDLAELETLLNARIKEAATKGASEQTVADILQETRNEAKPSVDA